MDYSQGIVVFVCIAIGLGYTFAPPVKKAAHKVDHAVVTGAKKTGHAILHTVTLGKK